MADPQNLYGTREAHPYANIFPLLPETELKALADDIAVHGLREPVWVHRDGRIIDGRNRWRACELAGVEPECRTYQGDDAGLLGFVISLNLHRRHLDESQRSMVAATIANMGVGRPSSNPANLPLFSGEEDRTAAPAVSQAEAAKLLNVGERSVRDARKVQEHGVPELAEKVVAGRTSVSAAAAIAEAEEKEQREALAAAEEAGRRAAAGAREREAAAEAARAEEKEIIRRANEIKRRKKEQKEQQKRERAQKLAEQAAEAAQLIGLHTDAATPQAGQWWQLGRHRLYCGDSTDAEFIKAAEGAAFAFADPPYNAGKADWDQDFTWQHDYLTETAGTVAVTPGISAIQDFFAATAMPYRWSMAAWITNGMTRGALGFGNWIYLALFSHGESLHRNAQDVLRITIDTATTAETNHASRKPARLLVDLIDLFTDKGDTVVDPFLGSGTTLFAADQTGRTCIGAELDLNHCGEIIAKYGPEAQPL
ncbi:MAG TPA: DNA methyltransferase [Methylomirabilota bacterium]|nr:DNA methyltransferase [Methylomirabilota bacterium]